MSKKAQKSAEVAYIEGDYAFLKTDINTSCGECPSKASCGSVKLFKPVSDTGTIKVENSLGLKAGDTVQLGLAPSKLIQGTLLVYIFPLLALFLFAALGKVWGGEAVSILAGLAGLVIALFLVRKFLSQENISAQFSPEIVTNSASDMKGKE